MTEGDVDGGAPAVGPLKVARLRIGWSQAAAMRRFQDAVTRHGAAAPAGASLRRMFAYWESGERAVTVPAYRLAFVDINRVPPEALGFVPPDESGRIAEIRCSPFALVKVDADLVGLFESQARYLRLLDRKAEARIIRERYGHIAGFIVAHGYPAGAEAPTADQ